MVDQVVIDQVVGRVHEPLLLPVGPDGTSPRDGLPEVGEDRRPGGGLQTLQLTGRGDVEPLGRTERGIGQLD